MHVIGYSNRCVLRYYDRWMHYNLQLKADLDPIKPSAQWAEYVPRHRCC
jgi:hypothetical protein